ncbi:hypothetical protein [Helicobacter sp. UBA3407]|uniref:hypothetical protein n=1 Tax=Helicobacter TaxID=209 RepID=UPI0026119740|nr:hypothetical protein [Helicobacter sp. UBA3407]
MSEKELEIFELCERLAELLGDKEAIADLKKLYEKHPEMFKDMQEVSNVIKEVVSEPEIAVDANKDNRDYEVIKVAKILNAEKMADVVIKNEKGTKVIYNKGFQHSEVAGASDILESGGEVSKPSDLQIKYTANQDFGKNPQNIIPQNEVSLEQKLEYLKAQQQEIANLPRASEVSIQEEEDTKHNNKLDEARHNKRTKQ